MDLEAMKKSWDELGRTDPIASMLAWDVRGKINDVDELFEFGQRETEELIAYIKSLGIKFQRERALDFGCGLGRTTQALAHYFDEVYGVDIAPSLIDLANKYNHHGNKCKYFLNEKNDLELYADHSFDLILCYGTLQLVKPRYFEHYIREFLRTLRPGGLLIIQHASEPSRSFKGLVVRVVPTGLMNLYRRHRYGFEVYAMRRQDVIRIIKRSGGDVMDVKKDRRTIGSNWIGAQYCVLKKTL